MAGELKNRNEQLKGLQARFEIFYAISKELLDGVYVISRTIKTKHLPQPLLFQISQKPNLIIIIVLYIFFEENKVTQHYMKHCLKFLLEIMHCHTTYSNRLVTNLLADN